MRMLRWICGVTKENKPRNDHVRESVKVASVTKKITHKMLEWYRHVKRWDEWQHVPRSMSDAPVPGKRWSGRQKTWWKVSCKRDMESMGLKEEDVLDGTKLSNDTKTTPATSI